MQIHGGAGHVAPLSFESITVGSVMESVEAQQQIGRNLGVDGRLGKHFAFTGGLRYLDLPLKTDAGDQVAVNPLIGRLGVAIRF